MCSSKGITWDWETFPQFMDAAATPRLRHQSRLPRAADSVSPLRDGRGVDGARGDAAETAQIAALLREAVGAGALGFSTTTWPQHIGYKGRPLACRNASRDELKAYANVLRELGQGAIEVSLTRAPGIHCRRTSMNCSTLLLTRAGGR